MMLFAVHLLLFFDYSRSTRRKIGLPVRAVQRLTLRRTPGRPGGYR